MFIGHVPQHQLRLDKSTDRKCSREEHMPKFVIERDLPGAGKLSDDEIHDI
jgi:hypothetical protein